MPPLKVLNGTLVINFAADLYSFCAVVVLKNKINSITKINEQLPDITRAPGECFLFTVYSIGNLR